MVNGYNSRFRSSYMQYGNAMPMPPAAPNIGFYPQPPQMNISHQTYNTSVRNTLAQQPQTQPVPPAQQPQQPKPQAPTEPKKHGNSLWDIIKSDRAAIITGTVVSLAAILIMLLSPKKAATVAKSKSGKNTFSRMMDNIKTKWTNYRADYKARMAAKAPEHCMFTPYIIR